MFIWRYLLQKIFWWKQGEEYFEKCSSTIQFVNIKTKIKNKEKYFKLFKNFSVKMCENIKTEIHNIFKNNEYEYTNIYFLTYI